MLRRLRQGHGCRQLIEVNEQICQLRPVPEVADSETLEQLKKNCSGSMPGDRAGSKRVGPAAVAGRQNAPFLRLNGSPYLEPHHTDRLSDGGPDDLRTVAGVCPNCHRRIHHGKDGDEVNKALKSYLSSLESELEPGHTE
jgi:hypothetical protein